MLARLRHVLLFSIALAIGYVLGDGPAADWLSDIFDMLRMAWANGRVSRGSGGPLPFLVAGYLLGQGLFLLLRRVFQMVRPWRVRRQEELAEWDPSTNLANRFGLFRYLQRCWEWSTEDLATRTQSLALFKLRGIDRLNDEHGTQTGTMLLQRFAAELRAASISEDSSAIGRWLNLQFPPRDTRGAGRIPPTRFPARWSGASFALAFRELEAVRVVSIVRDVSNWMRSELRATDATATLSLSATVVLGGAGTPWRTLTDCAVASIAQLPSNATAVVLDPNDVRSSAISLVAGVQVEMASLQSHADYADSRENGHVAKGDVLRAWLRSWGPSLACLAGALAVLSLSGGKATPTTTFPWPDSLTQVQVVDPSGTKSVRIVRTHLAPAETPRWRVSNVLILQGDPADGPYTACQLRASVTNLTRHTYHISTLDFAVVDTSGRRWIAEPTRVVRMQDGLTGRWVAPGETVSGWLMLTRGSSPLTTLVFEPDRFTRLAVSSKLD